MRIVVNGIKEDNTFSTLNGEKGTVTEDQDDQGLWTVVLDNRELILANEERPDDSYALYTEDIVPLPDEEQVISMFVRVLYTEH